MTEAPSPVGTGPQAILLVEDNPVTRRMLRVALEGEGYEVLEAGDGMTAIDLLDARRPALVLQDYVLPDMTGHTLAEAIRSHPHGETIPVVLLTGLQAISEDAHLFTAVLRKPVVPSAILDLVDGLLTPERSAPRPGARRQILVVDDEPLNRKLAAVRLGLAGFQVATVESVEAALQAARHSPPDLILADVLMPGLDGFQLCTAVRREPGLALVPIVLVSSAYRDEEDRNLALSLGATDLVTRSPALTNEVKAIERALAEPARSPPDPLPELDEAYLLRLRRQVDLQLSENQALAERTAIQAAALSMVGALAHSLERPGELSAVLSDVLVHCLDAAGLSSGVLYLREPGVGLRLLSRTGLPDVERAEVEEWFGHPELFEAPLDGTSPSAFSLETSSGTAARDLLTRARARSALIVPFVVASRHFGTLMLVSNAHDLSLPTWIAFGRALGVQFGQALALGQALAAKSETEKLFHGAWEASPAGMLMADASGTIVLANARLGTIFGYATSELIGSKIERLLPEHLVGAHERHRERFASHHQGRPMVSGQSFPGRHKDGRSIMLEIGLASLSRDSERFTLASILDMTEREAQQRQLTQTSARLSAVMQHAPEGIAVLSMDGRILEANEQMALLIDRPIAELSDRSLFELAKTEAERGTAQEFLAAIAHGGGQVLGVHLGSAGRGVRIADFSLARVDLGEERLVLVIGRDVTEQRQIEERLARSERIDSVGRLAGGIAHDFNNLLTAIFGNLELARAALPEGCAAAEDLEEIGKAALRATALTRQLLAFSRRQVMQPTVLSLNAVITDIERMLRRIIGEDLRFSTRLAPGIGHTRADAGQLEQVIVNLVVNARDAMPDGGELSIETANMEVVEEPGAAVPPGCYVMLIVRDTGIGMTPEVKARVFEPFFTTKGRDRGTGLGLSTVYGIVKQLGGYIWIESEPGAGTTFKLYFPRIEAPLDAKPAKVAPPPSRRAHETVLLAEDDDQLRPLVTSILKREGYEVLTAANTTAALAAAGAHHGMIDLLLTDLIMPGGSGKELADRLGALRPKTKVLYVSGYTDDAIVRHGMLEPGLNYLQKPYTPGELALKVRSVLDG